MVMWRRIYRSESKCGLGGKVLTEQNISLLVKWWWKLEKRDGLWERIVKHKYLRNKSVANVKTRFIDSPCWKALLNIKEVYMAVRKVLLKNGNLVRCLAMGCSFAATVPSLFDFFQEPACYPSEEGCIMRF
jgi:hypothetical protein